MKKPAVCYCFYAGAVLVIVLSSAGAAPAACIRNTHVGTLALNSNTTGCGNTAVGFQVSLDNTEGSENTATGESAMQYNKTGSNNTATGVFALLEDGTGNENTATGAYALQRLGAAASGSYNTATGAEALKLGLAGNYNTATGWRALGANYNQGSYNTATGSSALGTNTTGNANTATGISALYNNTTGGGNTADGVQALHHNIAGGNNTAAGFNALYQNRSGQNNIGLGLNAGFNLTTGNNNIDIGNRGVAGESNTIRIGTQGTQNATFIAGISGNAVLGTDVVVTSTGRLGILASSARFKRDIRDMGALSSNLLKLRPVTFRYKDDPARTPQYGLVAEEVARLYPELVSYGADGRVESVRYSMLTSMLLNEMQKQTRQNKEQAEQLQREASQLSRQAQQIQRLTVQIAHDESQRTAFEARFARLEEALHERDATRARVSAFER